MSTALVPAKMFLFCIRFCRTAPSPPTLSRRCTIQLCPKLSHHGRSFRSPGSYSPDFRPNAAVCLSRSSICHKAISPGLLSSAPKLPVRFPDFSGPVKKFHTSAGFRAPPAALMWLLVKPLQKITAIILGR